MNDTFRLNLAEFEGPLDLLLYLVRRNDLDILELSVSEIADQYIVFIEQIAESGYRIGISVDGSNVGLGKKPFDASTCAGK